MFLLLDQTVTKNIGFDLNLPTLSLPKKHDFSYETLQKKDIERCMFIVQLLLWPYDLNCSK